MENEINQLLTKTELYFLTSIYKNNIVSWNHAEKRLFKRSYIKLFAIFLKSDTVSSHQLISNNNRPVLFLKTIYLGIKTVSCHLLQWMATMDIDWNVEKLGQPFQVLLLYLQK